MVAVTAFNAIVIFSMVAVASAHWAPCSAGARVYSLSVWSGLWLDGLVMRCTGDGEEQSIPPDINDHPGGEVSEEICAGTGGVDRIEWGVPSFFNITMVYVNITCRDNETYQVANERPYHEWNVTENGSTSCEDGQYVQGVRYETRILENFSFPYFLTRIEFMCSSSSLDPICTGCSGDATLKSEEDQPEYCELPSCSEAECCERIGDETENATTTVIIGVVTTVVAAMIISGSAWAFKKFKKNSKVDAGVEDFHTDDTPCRKHPVTS